LSTTPPDATPGPDVTALVAHDPYAALRSPSYRRYVAGWAVAAIGMQVQTLAVGWELYERTNSALMLGYIGLAQVIPVLLFTLVGGHAADLYDRRRLAQLSQVAFALCSLGLAAVSAFHGPVWAIYALLVAAGTARAFNVPARASLLPLIVPPEVFGNLVTWNSGAFQLAAIGGPALGGYLIHLAHAAWPAYVLAAGGGVVFAISLFGVHPHPTPPRQASVSLRAMVAGLSHVWREKTVLAAITLDLFAVLLGGATSLLPVYAKDILHVGPVGLGVLRSAPYLGALLMALTLVHRPPLVRAGPALLWSVAGFGVATIVFGISPWFGVSLLMLALAGAVDNISVVIRQVLVQMRTPDEVRGRVNAVNFVFIECSNELGGFESGVVANYFGPVFSVVSGGVGTILVVITVALLWPEIRRLRRL